MTTTNLNTLLIDYVADLGSLSTICELITGEENNNEVEAIVKEFKQNYLEIEDGNIGNGNAKKLNELIEITVKRFEEIRTFA